MSKKYLVVYVTDNGDLYFDEFKTREAADKFLAEDIEEYKAQLFSGEIEHLEDRT